MYTEDRMAALPYRREILSQTGEYLKKLEAECETRRSEHVAYDFSSREAYEKSAGMYRRELIETLGRPLSEYPSEPPKNAELKRIGEDEFGTIDRIWIETLPGLFSYGLLFTPFGEEKYPLITALHGGLGTPEIVSSFYDSANYNDMVVRVRRKIRAAVYAPQMMLWSRELGETDADHPDNIALDVRLKQCGGSIAALEIFKIMRSVDWLCENRPIDVSRMGIVGLSYGGFYTLFTAACDTRYKTALSSCFFNDRIKYSWGDWVWFDSASKFLDPEVAAMICPRALCVEVGADDPLFDAASSQKPRKAAEARFEKLGIPEKFRFTVNEGGHQFGTSDDNIDFFLKNL